jgi:hypothetical protein
VDAGHAVDHRVDHARHGASATTGTPHAIASSGTIPNGSYHGTHTTASAERSSAREAVAADAGRAARRDRRRRGLGERRSRAPRVVAERSAAGRRRRRARVGQRRERLDDVAEPLRSTSAGATGEAAARRAAPRAVGRKRSRSTPHGTTVTRVRSRRGAELEDLVGAGRDDLVGRRHDVALECEALRAGCVASPW